MVQTSYFQALHFGIQGGTQLHKKPVKSSRPMTPNGQLQFSTNFSRSVSQPKGSLSLPCTFALTPLHLCWPYFELPTLIVEEVGTPMLKYSESTTRL